MSDFYFDEDHGIAYKVDPIVTSLVHSDRTSNPEQIIVHTDVKVTNIRKQKIRRTLSEVYPSNQYDMETAKRSFYDNLLLRFISGAKKISEQEYEAIKSRYEA